MWRPEIEGRYLCKPPSTFFYYYPLNLFFDNFVHIYIHALSPFWFFDPRILTRTICVGMCWSLVDSPFVTQWKPITVPYPESIRCQQFIWEWEVTMSPSPPMIDGWVAQSPVGPVQATTAAVMVFAWLCQAPTTVFPVSPLTALTLCSLGSTAPWPLDGGV